MAGPVSFIRHTATKRLYLFFALLVITLGSTRADTYAVIVAGSNGYQNYRHQADVCHAYQLLRSNGVPQENVVTMAYDDVAGNEGNPFPGKLFNTVNGSDVYNGCVLDYTGSSVSMETFFQVLHGNQSAQVPKVLRSSREDNVFIVYTDHGAPGYVTFPSGVAMYAPDLNDALVTMRQLGKYKKLLFYMDACNSGSMFGEGLLKAPNVLAVTAASKSEESYAAFCPPYDKVAAESHRETYSCLGDVFSINWMQDFAGADSIQTVGDQIDLVSNQTSNLHVLNRDHNSHVQVFGDLSVKQMALSSFQGNGTHTESMASTQGIQNGVSARDVQSMLALYRWKTAAGNLAKHRAKATYDRLVSQQDQVDARYAQILKVSNFEESHAVTGKQLSDRNIVACYKKAVIVAKGLCEDGDVSEYAMKHHGLLVQVCESALDEHRNDVDAAVSYLEKVVFMEACSNA